MLYKHLFSLTLPLRNPDVEWTINISDWAIFYMLYFTMAKTISFLIVALLSRPNKRKSFCVRRGFCQKTFAWTFVSFGLALLPSSRNKVLIFFFQVQLHHCVCIICVQITTVSHTPGQRCQLPEKQTWLSQQRHLQRKKKKSCPAQISSLTTFNPLSFRSHLLRCSLNFSIWEETLGWKSPRSHFTETRRLYFYSSSSKAEAAGEPYWLPVLGAAASSALLTLRQ